MLQPDEPFEPSLSWVAGSVEVLDHVAKAHRLSALAVEKREFGPVAVERELVEGWQGGGYSVR